MRSPRNTTEGGLLAPSLKALLVCGVLGAAGLGYLWQQKQIHLLAGKHKQCEQRLAQLQRENRSRRAALDYLRLLPVIESRVKEMNLGLAPAQPEQIVRLAEVSSTPPGKGFPSTASRTVALPPPTP